jgi:hypothetical protein
MVREAYERLQSWRAVARELGWPRSTVRLYQRKLGATPLPIVGGDLEATQARKMPLPKKGEVRRYILTCAQNNTHHHAAAWTNLVALAEHMNAEILISRFAYNVSAWAQQKNVKPGTARKREDLWYDDELAEHFCDERVELAPGLVFCGESNISPTAVRPLSGLEGYTGRASAIFPHTKIAMESVASGKNEGTKLLYTTGTVTLRNYIQRKAGLKAEFHHTYGALLVEVNSNGNWFCRQLNASGKDGTIYDLDLCAKDGEVTSGHKVKAITFGDVHAAQVDPGVAELGWGPGGMIDALQPHEVHLHDLLDFRARNHHDTRNCHLNFQKYVTGLDNVQEEIEGCVELVQSMQREGCKVVVVQSNHDNALLRWLREADYRNDPTNAIIFLKCQARVYESIARQEENFHLLEWVMQQLGTDRKVQFLRTDESYILCRDRSGGIECGMHGHDGANGTKGSALGFSKMGRKANIGHTHQAQIMEGVFVAGTSSKLDLGYNSGPSSWTHSHIITYQNGKRAIVTMYGGAWRAE